ncbi:hypothetical protein N0V82_001959 [Gnomoniopsis sp. IMI 355080]|nr:hypothetical protein N0V82_001959 [Gnomoniopsis sp. IMI 355080]
MASYGGGGQGDPAAGPPRPAGDGSIDAILARLKQSQQSQQQRPNRSENADPNMPSHYDQQRQYALQQLQQQQAQQWQQPGPDMRNPQHHGYTNSQLAATWNQSQQSADYPVAHDPAGYPPPAAPTPPTGAMYPPGMGALSKDNTLLNLLKVNSGEPVSQPSSQPTVPSQQTSDLLRRESMIRHASDQGSRIIHAPAPNSADPTGMLAALMLGRYQDDAPKPEPQEQQQIQQEAPANNWNTGAPPDATQQYLLNLLNKPKPSQHDAPVEAPANEPTAKDETAVPTASSFEFAPKEDNTPHMKFEDPSPAVHSGREGSPATATHAAMFNYKNPFHELSDASQSPRNRASISPSLHSQVKVIKSDEHKRLSSTSSHLEGRDSVRRKYDSTPTSQGHHSNPPYPIRESSEDRAKETVSEAVSDIAATVDQEAQEAVARAENEQTQARISQELEDMMAAETNKEFESAAAIVASDIKHELEKDENSNALDILEPQDAKAVRAVLDEVSQGPVVDSWESAEAEDEIVVIEETSNPITVWNFPMKPWITITVKETSNDKRPVFRDESILDIARLKKDFDQMDRNLVASSENTLAYGMSKAGGLRVIRQDDGRDAKLFSDTKDRIFNVAISSTPADENTTAKEAIIGTGISGTVYWIQIKDGEKDHVEDAHIEQYGFALSPSSAQEGEAPGGVLKTRARPSSNHPEYFAVGRGKSINIIFPAFVMQRNLLKPNHDRVVDTDRLAKECSLKINTGKAGKDFSFSHDDTMVVSLDKSGRVKFWDVRELTATDENRMPVHTSFEVKDPLMTLTTTPEGEKAWPTSVLLLDKLRPYQKRTALRYMIVGMKQNHTLQLWDLALGKPVQEFNLPHSKESDAVCSVMYHPPSGIIVVGHPTRNSIYFLHLSAPKYALKNSTQVDYIHKLVAQDPNLPNPESTAVISGMREYSFANKGILRSLYLLQQPASASDGDEATLFELYAMHSKGVACLSIKAPDLGWDKDNKVVEPMDAVEAGVVEIGKLKQPPPPAPVHPAEEPQPAAPIRLAVRPKEPPVEPTPEQPATRKSREDVSPPNKQKEAKEEEATPSTSEKPERKSRKKKAAAEKAAAAAAALAEREALSTQTNGTHPRVVNTTTRKSPEPSKPSSSFTQEVDTRIHSMEKRLAENIIGSVESELTTLRKSLARDAQDRDDKFTDKQRDLLSLVSECLNENCQELLVKIIKDELEYSVIPAVGQTLTQAVSTSLDGKLSTSIAQSVQKALQREVQRELQKALPLAMEQALRKPDLVKAITDKMVGALANKIDEQLYTILDDKIIPRFTKIATEAASSCGNEILANVSTNFTALEQIRAQDNQKLEHLIALNTNMSETLNTLVTAQTRYQDEILQLKAQLAQQQVSPLQTSSQQTRPGGQRGGNGTFHSPSNSQVQAPQHLNASVSNTRQQPSPLGSMTAMTASQYSNPSLAGLSSPPHVQQWANSSSIVSPQQQYPGSATLQAINPNMAALQQSQQFGSPASQVSSQVSGHMSSGQVTAVQQAQQLAREQVVFQPTTQENRQRIELDEICQRVRNHMSAGNLDEAVMTWIQESKDEEHVFSQVLAKYDPKFIRKLNPLLLLTVAATVTSNLDKTQVLHTKLTWTEMILLQFAEALPTIEGQVREVAPRVMSLIKGRLEHVLVRLSTMRPNDPILRNVSQMIDYTRKIVDTMGMNMAAASSAY